MTRRSPKLFSAASRNALGPEHESLGGSLKISERQFRRADVTADRRLGRRGRARDGDITLAGTGASRASMADHVTASAVRCWGFWDVRGLTSCAAEIVTSFRQSFFHESRQHCTRTSGPFRKDRLSAVSGQLGAGPERPDVRKVLMTSAKSESRTLHFPSPRQQNNSRPLIVAPASRKAILGTNDAGFTNGFRVRQRSHVRRTARRSPPAHSTPDTPGVSRKAAVNS